MHKNFALVSDFDGTISDNDFFYYLAEHYFDQKMLEPWNQYLAGHKKHFDALSEMFANLRISEQELHDFILSINIDKTFYDLADFCMLKNIPIYICSAGCDYYIKILLAESIKKYDIKIISNSGSYSSEQGLKMLPNKQFFDINLGISKVNLIKYLKENNYYVVFCGDGLPDIEPAIFADKVFARKMLYQQCRNKAIEVDFLQNFDTVKKFFEENTK